MARFSEVSPQDSTASPSSLAHEYLESMKPPSTTAKLADDCRFTSKDLGQDAPGNPFNNKVEMVSFEIEMAIRQMATNARVSSRDFNVTQEDLDKALSNPAFAQEFGPGLNSMKDHFKEFSGGDQDINLLDVEKWRVSSENWIDLQLTQNIKGDLTPDQKSLLKKSDDCLESLDR